MAAVEVDLSYLSAHVGVPQLSLDNVVTAPTAELVRSVLEAVVSKLRELEQDKFQLEIELEGAVRSSESRCEQFKATADKALKDVDEIRQKLQTEETARRALENELQTLKSSGTASISEIETLRARITSLEVSNRETLAIVDSKTTANASLAEELQKQHQKTLKLNQEITALNQSVQTTQTAANSAKYREESLKQELELAKKSNEWFEAELSTKSAENIKFRREKGARIAELQRLNEEANSTIESLTRNDQVLRKRLEEAQSKAQEALTKVQQLQEAAARAEEGFKQELESSRRLVELKDQQSQTHRNRLKEVELRLEQVKDDGADEIRRIRLELEQEKQDHVQTEQHVQELETEVDRLKAVLESHDTIPSSAPQTPRANGAFLGRSGSPFGTPASMRGKASFRATDALEELYTVKGQLSGEKRRNKKLQEDLDDAVSMLEAKLPEIDELSAESERLRNELVHMSEIAQQSYEERDAAVKVARKADAAAASTQAEIKILRTQLRDLSTQIHVLIFNIHAQEKGMDQLTDEEVSQFERLQRGEVAENALDDMSDTHQFITEKFVAYKDIYELQAKNQELLRVTRDLADKMENEEALAAKQVAAHDHQEVQQLRGTVAILQDEVQSITVRMRSYMTERDMFRRMLQQKANPAEIHAALGTSADQRQVLASIEQNSSTDEADLTAALRELQSQFDSYRNDQTTDRNSMKEQIERLSAEKSTLQSEVSRVSSQLTLATERYNMLESNFKAAQTENRELQKRAQILSEAAAKQDMRTQQVAEDLVEARGLTESLRSENANLKAEKTLWKSIQDRLSQDNETLAQDRTRLNNLVSNQQSLLNERELSESETKRRLQGQIDSLDAELNTTKRKLAEEVEGGKKIQLRKEFDAQQYQKRIDDLTSTIGQIKEENVAVKTTRDHLQARVGELEIELRNAQERAERLRPIPTSRSQTLGASEQASAEAESQARIEELENEVQDLKNSLELVNAQLDNTKQQSDNFMQLSRELEQELASMSEAQELYRAEMDAAIASKESGINELQQRVEALTTELGSSNSELNALRDSQADVSRKFEEKERMLLSDISRLKTEESRYKETARFHQQDLRAQAEIATKAQQDYEQELVRHAEAAKLLQQIRAEHNILKTDAAAFKAEADSARLSLAQSEQSWEERRQHFEQEIAEIKVRRDDVVAQNKLLHQQLDGVTAQISALQQSRANGAAEGPAASVADTATEGLRELNGYLRREKEILEVQYDLKVQEARRLQQQFEYSQSQLDEARLKLEQERRSQADSSQNSITHKELMDKLNELNLIRESNVTLRNENQRTQAQLEQKTRKISELEARIHPLEARISELQLDKNFKEAEIKQLQEARDGLQKRIESILSKYGQADPHEVEQLKATIAGLEAERDALKLSEQSLQEKVTEIEATLETERGNWNTRRERLTDDFKTRFRNMKTQRDEIAVEKNTLQTSLDSVNQRLSGVETELGTAKQDLTTLKEKNKQLQDQAAAVPTAEPAAPPAAPAQTKQVAEQDPALLQQLQTTKQELDAITAQKAALEAEMDELRGELEEVRTNLATAIAERDEARADAARQPLNGADVEMGELTEASQVASLQPPVGDSGEQDPKVLKKRIVILTAELAETKARLAETKARLSETTAKLAESEAKVKDLEDNAESIIKQRSDKMKNALNKRLAESKEAMEKQTHEEKEKLQAEFDLRLQQELAIVKAEQQSAVPSTPAKPPTSDNQIPPTPTGSGAGLPDLSNFNDAETRDFVMKNPTVMSIVRANVKKMVAVESKKARDEADAAVKAEYEQKINTAKEQAVALNEKKSALRLNMLDRQNKLAQAKISVIETAAKETPQRPVVEVWDIAKDTKLPAPPPTPTPVPTPDAGPAAAPASGTSSAPPSASTAGPDAVISKAAMLPEEHKTPQASGASQTGLPQPPGKPAGAAPHMLPNVNPFGQPQAIPSGLPNNPFGAPQSHITAQVQAQMQQAARTGIPIPARGGANIGRGGGRGGGFQHGGAPGRGGQGLRGRGGFGRGGGGNGGNMNPHAGEFSPGGGGAAGNKRPRDDSGQNGGGGTKRPRGGGPPGV